MESNADNHHDLVNLLAGVDVVCDVALQEIGNRATVLVVDRDALSLIAVEHQLRSLGMVVWEPTESRRPSRKARSTS